MDVRWRPEPRVTVDDQAFYQAVVRAAFGQRRKMLRNALAALAAARGMAAGRLDAVLRQAGVDPAARAETLDLDAFGRLARSLAG